MTSEEAIENLKGLLESNYVDSFEDEENESLRMAIQALEQKSNLEKICEELAAENDDLRDQLAMRDGFKIEPCDDVARERYKDLCEYFGDAKDILKNREDFNAWLERIKWHVRKAEELYEKYEHRQEPCDDAISRQAVIEIIDEEWLCNAEYEFRPLVEAIEKLPSVRPQEQTGHWIEDEYEMLVRCSECGEENDECSKYCPNCGARMVEPQERSE